MPGISIAGCRTASAFDSLPRNQRGSSAAIHRLRTGQHQGGAFDSPAGSRSATPGPDESPDNSAAGNDFLGRSRKDSASVSPSRRDEGRSGSSSGSSGLGAGLLRRSSSAKSRASSMAGAFSPVRRRTLSRPGPGPRSISSVDLPPASSDLERVPSQVENRSPFGRQGVQDDCEADWATARGGRASADIFRPATSMSNRRLSYDGNAAPTQSTQKVAHSAPSSPKKHRSTKSLSISGPVGSASGGIEGGPRAAPGQRSAVPAPAKKRVVDKSMIGLPTNFQHTGHIGAANYGAALTHVDPAALAAQLSEVAAALNDFDLGPLSGPGASAGAGKGPAQPPTKGDVEGTAGMPTVGHVLDTVVEADDTPAASRILGRNKDVVDPPQIVNLTSGPSAVAAQQEPVMPAPPASAPEPSDFMPPSASSQSLGSNDEAPASIRAVPRTQTIEDLGASTPTAPSPRPSTAALPFQKPTSPSWTPSPSRPTGSATLGYAQSTTTSSPTPGPFGSPTRGAGQVPSSVRGPASPSMLGTSGAGRGKRKPVPRGAMGLHDLVNGTSGGVTDSPETAARATLDEEDTPLNPLPASLQRNESTVGELPKLGGASSRTSAAAANSLRGAPRATPLERAEMVAKRRLEEAQSRVMVGAKAGPEGAIGLYLPDEEATTTTSSSGETKESSGSASSAAAAKMAGSIRVAGKRMVPGPSGDYITDTANGRWNSALADITRALAVSAADEEDLAKGLGDEREREERKERNEKTERELIEEGLRQADEVLRRLEVDV